MEYIHLWSIVVAGIVSMVIGSLWYSPLLFGTQWINHMKFSSEKIKTMEEVGIKGMKKLYAANFISGLVMMFVLAVFIDNINQGVLGIQGLKTNLTIAFWIWLGFIATVNLGSVLWEDKSWKLYAINVGYYLVTLLIGAVIIGW